MKQKLSIIYYDSREEYESVKDTSLTEITSTDMVVYRNEDDTYHLAKSRFDSNGVNITQERLNEIILENINFVRKNDFIKAYIQELSTI